MVIALILLNAISLLSLLVFSFKDNAIYASTASQSGKIVVQVLESNSNRQIDGATVCVIETRHYENTDKYGKTSMIEVPIIRNSNFDISLERPFGEVTLLVYKNGYADSINFYQSVMPGSTRVGIVIYLTPIISESDNKTEISMEKPNEVWINNLINLYKKRI